MGRRQSLRQPVEEKVKPDAVWGYNTRGWLKGAGQPQAVRDYLGFKENEWPMLHVYGESHVFHFGGARRKAVFDLIVNDNPEAQGFVSANEWYFKLNVQLSVKPTWLREINQGNVVLRAHQQIETLEKTLARPRANRLMPLGARKHEVLSWLNLESELKSFQESIWVTAIDKELSFALGAFV